MEIRKSRKILMFMAIINYLHVEKIGLEIRKSRKILMFMASTCAKAELFRGCTCLQIITINIFLIFLSGKMLNCIIKNNY